MLEELKFLYWTFVLDHPLAIFLQSEIRGPTATLMKLKLPKHLDSVFSPPVLGAAEILSKCYTEANATVWLGGF